MPLLDGSHAAVGNIIRALPPSENARRTYCGFQATGERLRLLIMKTSVAQPSCPARLLPAADTGPSGSPPDLSSGRRFLQNEGLPRLSPHLDCWLTALPLSSQGLSAPGSASPLSQGHQSCETTVGCVPSKKPEGRRPGAVRAGHQPPGSCIVRRSALGAGSWDDRHALSSFLCRRRDELPTHLCFIKERRASFWVSLARPPTRVHPKPRTSDVCGITVVGMNQEGASFQAQRAARNQMSGVY